MPVTSKDTLKSYFETGDIPSEDNYVDLIDTIFGIVGNQVSEGPGIDILVNGLEVTVGLGLDSILISHANGSPAGEYPGTETGLTDCLLHCSDGDVVSLPNRSLSVDVLVPVGVKLTSIGNSKIVGTVTLSDRSSIENLTISPSKTQNVLSVVGVTGAGTGISNIYSCNIIPTNLGSGGVNAIRADGSYTIRCHESFLDGRGNAGGGPGYAAYRDSDSTIFIEGGTCLGSDPERPFNE